MRWASQANPSLLNCARDITSCSLRGCLLLQVATQWGTYQPSTTAAEERKELLLGPRARATMAREWNRLVDNTLGALATELGKRGI